MQRERLEVRYTKSIPRYYRRLAWGTWAVGDQALSPRNRHILINLHPISTLNAPWGRNVSIFTPHRKPSTSLSRTHGTFGQNRELALFEVTMILQLASFILSSNVSESEERGFSYVPPAKLAPTWPPSVMWCSREWIWAILGCLGAGAKFAKVIEVRWTVCSKLRETDAASARVGCTSPKVSAQFTEVKKVRAEMHGTSRRD